MNSLNSILIEGNLPADPEGNAEDLVCTFVVEYRRYTNGEKAHQGETGRIKIEAHGKTAESSLKTLKKGSGVRVVGMIKDVGDGRTIVIAEVVEAKGKFYKKPSEI